VGAKISGELIGTFNGLRIYGKLSKAKKKGKDRLWLHVRQADGKKWRIAATLSYANSIDIRFEGDAAGESARESDADSLSANTSRHM
jgi:hypothetical protein